MQSPFLCLIERILLLNKHLSSLGASCATSTSSNQLRLCQFLFGLVYLERENSFDDFLGVCFLLDRSGQAYSTVNMSLESSTDDVLFAVFRARSRR